MSEQKNDKWLDEMISKTINTTKPQFDVEKFKQKFPEEFQILQSRAFKQPQRSIDWTGIFKNPISIFSSVVKKITLAIGRFVPHTSPDDSANIPKVTKATQSPTDMMTILSLNIAFNRGGMEKVNRQYEQAVKKLGPRPKQILLKELFEELDSI